MYKRQGVYGAGIGGGQGGVGEQIYVYSGQLMVRSVSEGAGDVYKRQDPDR